MAHFWIKFTDDVLVSAGAHKVDRFVELLMANNTGVVGAGNEENWGGGIAHLPIFRTVGALHKAEERDKTVQREDEAVALVRVVGGDHGRIANNPSVRAVVIGGVEVIVGLGEFSGTLVVIAKSKVIDKVTAMTIAAEDSQELRDSDSGSGTGIIAGRAADNEATNVGIVFFHIATNDERAHAVAEESERETREALFDVFGDLMDVANNTIHAILAEIAIVIFRGDASAVPAVVMDDDDIAALSEVIYEIMVALAMLGHAMNELDDAFRLCGGLAVRCVIGILGMGAIHTGRIFYAIGNAEADA